MKNEDLKKYLQHQFFVDLFITDEYNFWIDIQPSFSSLDEYKNRNEEFYEMLKGVEPFKNDIVLLSKVITHLEEGKISFQDVWEYREKHLRATVTKQDCFNSFSFDSNILNAIDNLKLKEK